MVANTKPIQIVIDTNVLVSAYRSNRGMAYRLIGQMGNPRWEMNISTTLVLEYESALKREFKRQGRELALVDIALDYLIERAKRRNIFFRSRPLLSDPGDEFVLELAIASRADFIVTYNIRDYRGTGAYGVNAVTPAQFLEVLE